ncbi:MAG: hypothetical protein PHU63_04600 [Candidatus ainarchaeum sp.]|nr:hypothetical protein [Candidatus ainarchaeum sp.]
MSGLICNLIKKSFNWIKSIWFLGSNLIKITEGQKEINKRLGEIEQAIKSPQYQVAELEKIQRTIDLLKENNEQEKIKLQRGSQEEINKHRVKIDELMKINKGLAEYRNLVGTAIDIIKQKDITIKQLNAQIEELKISPYPSLLSLALAGQSEKQPNPNWLQCVLSLYLDKEKK